MQLRKVASSLSVLGVQGRVQALVSSMRATDDLPTRIRNVVVTGGPQVIAIFNTRSRQFDFMEDDRLRPPQVDGLNVPHDSSADACLSEFTSLCVNEGYAPQKSVKARALASIIRPGTLCVI